MFIFNYALQPFKAYCAILVRCSKFRHQASPRVSPRESTQRRNLELWARNVRQFCLNADLHGRNMQLRMCKICCAFEWLSPFLCNLNTTGMPCLETCTQFFLCKSQPIILLETSFFANPLSCSCVLAIGTKVWVRTRISVGIIIFEFCTCRKHVTNYPNGLSCYFPSLTGTLVSRTERWETELQ